MRLRGRNRLHRHTRAKLRRHLRGHVINESRIAKQEEWALSRLALQPRAQAYLGSDARRITLREGKGRSRKYAIAGRRTQRRTRAVAIQPLGASS